MAGIQIDEKIVAIRLRTRTLLSLAEDNRHAGSPQE